MTHVHEASQPLPPTPRQTIEAFSKLAELWGLTTDQQLILLGSPARSTFFKWKKEGGIIPQDTRERISNLFAINKSLQILMPDPDRAQEWLFRRNEYFDGQTALERMLEGGMVNIYKVREYLDAQRGG